MLARRGRAVEALEDVRDVLLGDPRAVVADGQLAVRRAAPRPASRRGLHLAALSSRFAIARSRLAGLPDDARRRRGRPRSGRPGWLRAARRIASSATRSSRTSSSCGGLLLAARELGQLADQLGHLAELLDHVAQELRALRRRQPLARREHLDVRAQARQRRPQLVRGVLDELPLALLRPRRATRASR